MDTFEAIYQRRAVKHYDPTHEFTDAEINKLMEAAIQSPSSFNIQNWRFVLVRDKELRKQLRVAAWDQSQVTDASLLLILTADTKTWETPAPYWKDAPKDIAEMAVNMTLGFYQGKDELQRDEGLRSCGIAGQTIMLAAKAMGYDSCPMIGYDPDQVANLINLPENHVIGFIITVGKATKPAWPKPGQLPLEEVVIHDKFSAQL
ncbi:MAG: nitroreductase family protein [Aeoliella sp.]